MGIILEGNQEIQEVHDIWDLSMIGYIKRITPLLWKVRPFFKRTKHLQRPSYCHEKK